MKSLLAILLFSFSQLCLANSAIHQELVNYWQESSRSVAEGDFVSYKASFHPQAILVTDMANKSYPIGQAFARWQQGFEDTKNGKITAGVEFRFSKSLIGETSAHQTGMFYYYSIDENGKRSDFIANFEALLTKDAGKWQMMMERHISQATKAEWEALPPLTD
ncbi:hypothetical protein [Thalassotalea ganghwensis]